MLRAINLVGQRTVWACIYLQIFSAHVHSSGRRTLAINHCSHNISKLSSIQPTLVCFLPRSKVVVVQCQQQPHPYILHLSISMSKYTYLCLAASGWVCAHQSRFRMILLRARYNSSHMLPHTRVSNSSDFVWGCFTPKCWSALSILLQWIQRPHCTVQCGTGLWWHLTLLLGHLVNNLKE